MELIFIEEQSNWSFMATNPVKTNASLLFTLAKFQVFCSDADDHHTNAATCTVAAHCTLFLIYENLFHFTIDMLPGVPGVSKIRTNKLKSTLVSWSAKIQPKLKKL